jgi:hypothetical protein
LIPYIGVSDEENEALCREFSLNYIWLQNKHLGRKHNDLLEYCLGGDYIMQLGSDDIILDSGIDILAEMIHNGINMAGFTDLVMIKGDKQKLYKGQVPFGAGRIFKTELVKGRIWTEQKMRGLDGDSFRGLKRMNRGLEIVPIKGFHIIDIKTESNLNAWEAFPIKETPIDEKNWTSANF